MRPLSFRPERETLDPNAIRVHDAEARLEELIADPGYRWARETLEGIYDTIQRTGRVTEGQWNAVRNIERREPRGSGYRRRW